ncbi:MAG: hypothetical protein HC804_04675 [Anaerolineae bacterium]|nr:hypothetical protein [Anaerolineae bacterium]
MVYKEAKQQHNQKQGQFIRQTRNPLTAEPGIQTCDQYRQQHVTGGYLFHNENQGEKCPHSHHSRILHRPWNEVRGDGVEEARKEGQEGKEPGKVFNGKGDEHGREHHQHKYPPTNDSPRFYIPGSPANGKTNNRQNKGQQHKAARKIPFVAIIGGGLFIWHST